MSEFFRAADIKAAHRSTAPDTLNTIDTLFGKNELYGLHKREYAATSESIPIKQPHRSAGDDKRSAPNRKHAGPEYPKNVMLTPRPMAKAEKPFIFFAGLFALSRAGKSLPIK